MCRLTFQGRGTCQTDGYIRRRIDQEAEDQGRICTVRDAGLAIKAVESMSHFPEEQALPDSLLEVFK